MQALRPVLRAEAGEVSADAVAILHRVTWMRLPQLNERMHSLQEFMRSGDAEEMLQLLLGHLPSKEADARQTEMPSGCPGALHVFRALTEDMGLLEHPEAERLDLLQGDNIESLLLRLVKVLEIDFLSRDADGSHGSGYCAQIGDDAARDTEGSGAALDEREERSCNGAIGAAMGIMNALLRHQHFHQVVCEGELLSDIVSYVAQATQLRCSCAWSRWGATDDSLLLKGYKRILSKQLVFCLQRPSRDGLASGAYSSNRPGGSFCGQSQKRPWG